MALLPVSAASKLNNVEGHSIYKFLKLSDFCMAFSNSVKLGSARYFHGLNTYSAILLQKSKCLCHSVDEQVARQGSDSTGLLLNT